MPPKVGSIANENNFYGESIEKYLSNEIENPANNVIDKIRNHHFPTVEERRLLAIYMVVMWKRVPQSIARMNGMAPEIAKKITLKTENEISDLIELNPDKKEILENRRKELAENIKIYSENPPKDFWLSLISHERTPNIIVALEKMTWQFHIFNDSIAFLTSDNPFFYFESIGIGRPESEFSFPISSHILLWGTWRKDFKEDFVQTNKQMVNEFNRRTASNYTRYIYHANEDYWIPKFINKNHMLNLIR